jgi:hypothetical protein
MSTMRAQKDAETFALHRRMETADDAAAFVPPLGSLIVGTEDGGAGTTGGTEERSLRQREQVEIAKGGEFEPRMGAQSFAQSRRITGIGGVERDERHGHTL